MPRTRRALSALLVLVAISLAPLGAAQERPATPLADALRALDRGEYGTAETALRAIASPEAQLALARVLLETGRHDEAQRSAETAARSASSRIAARTLAGEAHMARGRLDEAQRVLEEVASEPIAHRARVMLGRLLLRRGRESEARTVLMRLVRAYNDGTITSRDGEGLTYVGMAAAMLESPHDANDAFREATRVARDRVETQLEWATLFLSKFDLGHADECVSDALRVSPNHPRAHLLRARILLEQSFDFAGAERELSAALAVDPNLVAAHVTRAGMALRDVDIARADAHLDAALAIDPNDLEALSVRAAVRFVEGNQSAFDAAVRAVLDRNPRYAELYSIVADHADWEHRYPDVVELARRALRIDPEDARAHATLGLNLLRMGEEEDGLAALREAWRRDRFDARVFNTLNLWDDVITPHYERFDARPFVLRMHREERPLIEGAVTTTLRGAWDDMRRRYRFTPRQPVHIEMFASSQHFSVRTSGLPNAGVQGVCFGQVVTALSPRGGAFDWGQITTHELAHVFHIQLSRNRVPRWFTEGLAEHETVMARPEWRREEDHRLWLALDRLPPVRDLNSAFTHARSAEDVMTAYYASSRLVGYMVDRFGFDRVVAMLRGWGEGRSSADVVQRALGVSIDELDREWRVHERTRLAARARDFAVDFGRYLDVEGLRARVRSAPRDAIAHAELAAGLAAHGDVAGATQSAIEAIRIDPHQPIARFVLARTSLARRDAAELDTHIADLIASGHDGYEVRLLAAQSALARRDTTAARAALDAAASIDPERLDAWHGLAQLAESSQDAALRRRALERIVALDQHDRGALAALMQTLHEAGAWDALLAVGPRVVFVDPENGRGRWLHGEALLHAGRARDALAELDLALAAEVETPGPVHLARARALVALRRAREARESLAAAIAAEPALAAQAAAVLPP
ncbi:tetratricopeptide repeat protein [Sandaracinus amylolyticus]|nr:tetratricopeptide repeat protein [Sandaracinus amylolyticus]